MYITDNAKRSISGFSVITLHDIPLPLADLFCNSNLHRCTRCVDLTDTTTPTTPPTGLSAHMDLTCDRPQTSTSVMCRTLPTNGSTHRWAMCNIWVDSNKTNYTYKKREALQRHCGAMPPRDRWTRPVSHHTIPRRGRKKKNDKSSSYIDKSFWAVNALWGANKLGSSSLDDILVPVNMCVIASVRVGVKRQWYFSTACCLMGGAAPFLLARCVSAGNKRRRSLWVPSPQSSRPYSYL